MNTLQFLHILGADGRLLATPFAVVAGLTYNFLPFMVLPLFASIDKIDPRLIEASSDLYANPAVGFFKVTWPLSLPGVVSGTLLTFIPAAGDYINVQLLGSPNQRMVGIVIQSLFTDANDYPAAAALSMILMIDHRGAGAVLRPPRRERRSCCERRTGPDGWLRRHLVLILGLLVLLYTFVPIFVVVLMSFNDPASRVIYQFDGFTLDNWLNPCEPEGMCGALKVSIEIGLLVDGRRDDPRHPGGVRAGAPRLRRALGRQPADLPADGGARDRAGLVAARAVRRGRPRGELGFWTILVAHIMFCLSFVVVTVRARLAGLDDNLEQAAMDLYATPSQTFWRVTFPLVFPGILGAALLSFSLSFDDFIITNLNAGNTTTFPMFVWGAAQRGVPMQVNVVGTVMFADLDRDRGRRRGQRRSRRRIAERLTVAVPLVQLPSSVVAADDGQAAHRGRQPSTRLSLLMWAAPTSSELDCAWPRQSGRSSAQPSATPKGARVPTRERPALVEPVREANRPCRGPPAGSAPSRRSAPGRRSAGATSWTTGSPRSSARQ